MIIRKLHEHIPDFGIIESVERHENNRRKPERGIRKGSSNNRRKPERGIKKELKMEPPPIMSAGDYMEDKLRGWKLWIMF